MRFKLVEKSYFSKLNKPYLMQFFTQRKNLRVKVVWKK